MGVCAATSAASTTSQGPLAVNDFLRGKMKVLKKFKKKMGLAPRSGSSGGTNNLPPILFHQVHGDNIRVSRDGTVARRAESFCKGVTFSSRPIKVAEKVCVKFLEVSDNWSGVIRFGFTCNDPNNLRYGLPKYACPDLTNKPGYWAKALAERFAERDTVLFYYVTQAGDVYFGINGEEKGLFFSGVETRGPLWAIIDVYGNSTAIELVMATEPMYVGALAFGLTSCDPASIQGSELPDDSDNLLDRPEYWVVSKDVASCPQRGDELTFCVTHTGEVQFSKNGSPPVVFMHVDHTLQLWAFLDVYGSTQKVRICGSMLELRPASSSPPVLRPLVEPQRLRVSLPSCNGVTGDAPVPHGGPHPHAHAHAAGVPPPPPAAQQQHKQASAAPAPP
ncbi:Protein neuralized, partial [Gryllus bimaculatus]